MSKYAQYIVQFSHMLSEMKTDLNDLSFNLACEYMVDMLIKEGRLTLQAKRPPEQD